MAGQAVPLFARWETRQMKKGAGTLLATFLASCLFALARWVFLLLQFRARRLPWIRLAQLLIVASCVAVCTHPQRTCKSFACDCARGTRAKLSDKREACAARLRQNKCNARQTLHKFSVLENVVDPRRLSSTFESMPFGIEGNEWNEKMIAARHQGGNGQDSAGIFFATKEAVPQSCH